MTAPCSPAWAGRWWEGAPWPGAACGAASSQSTFQGSLTKKYIQLKYQYFLGVHIKIIYHSSSHGSLYIISFLKGFLTKRKNHQLSKYFLGSL